MATSKKPERLVVDANPILSALLGRKARRIFFETDISEFAVPEAVLEEVRKYIPAVARKLGTRAGNSRRLRAELPDTKMILQVHDELIFDVPEEDLDGAKKLVVTEMEGVGVGARLGLSVPLKVDVGVGPNWRAAHP